MWIFLRNQMLFLRRRRDQQMVVQLARQHRHAERAAEEHPQQDFRIRFKAAHGRRLLHTLCPALVQCWIAGLCPAMTMGENDRTQFRHCRA
jgi:hypothetical protein